MVDKHPSSGLVLSSALQQPRAHVLKMGAGSAKHPSNFPSTPKNEQCSSNAHHVTCLLQHKLYQPVSFTSYSSFLPIFWDGGDVKVLRPSVHSALPASSTSHSHFGGWTAMSQTRFWKIIRDTLLSSYSWQQVYTGPSSLFTRSNR